MIRFVPALWLLAFVLLATPSFAKDLPNPLGLRGFNLGMTLDEFACYADVVYDNKNIGAAIASGTYPVDGMIVAPCSMKTLAGIASGYSENLLLRAADVQMKEQRRLVLMVRETPFSAIHVDNMARLARVPGVMLMPPMLTFYNGPATLDEAVHHIAAKALEAVGVSCANYKRWS